MLLVLIVFLRVDSFFGYAGTNGIKSLRYTILVKFNPNKEVWKGKKRV